MKLSIQAKIFFSFLVIIVISAIFLFFSYSQLRKVQDLSAEIVPVTHTVRIVSSCIEKAENLETTVDNYILITSEDQELKLKTQINVFLNEINNLVSSQPKDTKPYLSALDDRLSVLHEHINALIEIIKTKSSSYETNKQFIKIFRILTSGKKLLKSIQTAEVRDLENITSNQQAIIDQLSRNFVIAEIMIFLIGLLASIILSDFIIRRLTTLKNYTKRISKGEFDESIKISSNDEIGELSKAFNNMAHDLNRLVINEKELRDAETKKADELSKLNAQLMQSEQELKVTNKQLKESTVQVIQSEKLAAVGEITASVAHELNQPLNVTKIICQSIIKDIEKDRFSMDDAKQDLPEIINQMNRMATIIDHMRVFSRRTEGKVEESLDINEVLENVFIFLGQQLKTRNIQIEKQYTPELPRITGDAIRLEQVFMNLITNARHALEKSDQENKKIVIATSLDDQGKRIVITVNDNGPGIPEQIKEKIFDSFFTTKEKGRGTGLGLSVCKKIVEEHRGSIEVVSHTNKGTTFRVVLPPNST